MALLECNIVCPTLLGGKLQASNFQSLYLSQKLSAPELTVFFLEVDGPRSVLVPYLFAGFLQAGGIGNRSVVFPLCMCSTGIIFSQHT